MFADGVMEGSNTLGTSDYTLTGAIFNGRTFGAAFTDEAAVMFIVQTRSRSKFEIILGSYDAGPPRKLRRTTVLLSSQGGAKVDWQDDDIYYIASFPSATVLAGLIKANLAASRPYWVQFGRWVREDYPTAGKHTEYFYDGVNDIALFEVDEATHLIQPAGYGSAMATFLATPTSANFYAALTTKTGSGGSVVFATGPTIAAPTFTGNVTTPDKTQAANDGYAVNSKYVDRVAIQQIVVTSDNALRTTSSTAIPADDTVPQNTEGDEYTQLATAFTPKSATSILYIELEVPAARAGADTIVMALFRDSVANALDARALFTPGNNMPVLMRLEYRMVAGQTSAINFKTRLGSNTANALYLNGISSGRLLGGVQKSFMKITEYGV